MKTTWTILSQVLRQWQQDGAFALAAALSFYAIISLAPLVTMSLSFASMFYGEEALRGELVVQVKEYVGEPGAEVIQNILANATKRASGFSAWMSLGILLVGASAVFAQLQYSLNTIWNVALRPDSSWWPTIKTRLVSIALVFGIGLLLLVFTIGGAVLSRVADFVTRMPAPGMEFLWQSVAFLVGVAVFTLLFAALYKFLPDALIGWRDVWVGALATSVLFNLGRLAIGLYLGKSAAGSAYGAAGSLIALALWIFYSALILFFGAEFAQVYARHCGRRIRPAKNAYRTSTVALPVDDDGNPILDRETRQEVKERVECPPDCA
jgi:membrane protein